MKHHKQDRRVNKTKNAITNTLLRLMEEKSVSEITVSELTNAADINRKTFYNHYENLDSVLKELEENCLNWVMAFVKDASFSTLLEDPASVYVDIARGLQRHRELLHLLYNSGVYPRLSSRITESLKDSVREKARAEIKPEYLPKADLLLDFVTAGAVGIYDTMFRKDDPTTLDEVTEFIHYFFDKSDIQGVLKEEFLK